MSSVNFVVVFLCIFASANCKIFQCPEQDLTAPCFCEKLAPFSHVTCKEAEDFGKIRESLAGNFEEQPIPWLRIDGGSGIVFGPNSFEDIPAERIVVNNTEIVFIDDEAFFGSENVVEFLVLQNSGLRSVPTKSLSVLQNLESLSLTGNEIGQILENSFRGLRELEHLVLANNSINQISQKAFSTKLQTLVLSQNRLNSLNNSVRNLPRLEWLLISNNNLTTLEGELDGLSSLRLLIATNNKIQELGSAFLDTRKLKVLNLAFNNISDLDLGLWPLTILRQLNVSHNNLETINPDSLARLKRLQVLDLSWNKLTTVGDFLKPLRHLGNLNLAGNQIVTVSHDEIMYSTRLHSLDLSYNNIMSLDGTFPEEGSRLGLLNLAGNMIESIALQNLSQLQILDLRYNQFRSLARNDVPDNLVLKKIYLDGNPWTCSPDLVQLITELHTRQIVIRGAPVCNSLSAIVSLHFS